MRVVIEHESDGKKYQSVYGHLSEISPEVLEALKTGGAIDEGATIGKMGNTGNVPKNSKGVREPQLHFEIIEGSPYKRKNSSVDPGSRFNTWDRVKNLFKGRPIPETRPPSDRDQFDDLFNID